MQGFIKSTIAVALCGLGWTTHVTAQEKVAAPPKTEICATTCLEKVCIAVPDTKRITKVVYSCTEKDICLPRCPNMLGNHVCSKDCCTTCARPRTVNVLMKRTVTTEVPATKCVVQQEEVPRCRDSYGAGIESAPATVQPAPRAKLAQPHSENTLALPVEPIRVP